MTENDTHNEEGMNRERESILAAQLNIPRESFKGWRESGKLIEETHWLKEGNSFVITPAGQVKVRELVGLESAPLPQKAPEIIVTVMNEGTMNRVLRCKDPAGQVCSVRLTGPRVFARMFRRHEKLCVVETETPGIYEYGGAAPRRTVL